MVHIEGKPPSHGTGRNIGKKEQKAQSLLESTIVIHDNNMPKPKHQPNYSAILYP
ncbi:MAG: hypothetical protein IIB02_03300 [Thaumarchaeota archaeon]|nr:hypothetical protein [Nitrososphaerota archaeon]